MKTKLIIFDSEKLPLKLVKENDIYLYENEKNEEEYRIIKNIKINRINYINKFKRYEVEVIVHYVLENSTRTFKDRQIFMVKDLNEIAIEICGVYREEKISYFETNFAG